MREQHGPMMEEPSSLRFGNYDLIERIDVGGMGEVYLARQRSAFGRKVAFKIIRSDLVHDFTARARFLREAQVSAHLQHEHILPLIEFNEDQGRLFLVTPYIEGGTLARRLQSGPLSLREVHHLFVPLAQAVAYIHRRGVIHRDLKPTNILLDSQDGQIYVRLIDFGIASLQGQLASAPLTTAGHELGTVAYMAPERLSGVAAPSNDIFSLGVILYQMLTGHFPTPQMHHRLPEQLEYVVRRSIAPRPEDRFATAEELLQAFERAYQQLIASPPQQVLPAAAVGVSRPSQGRFRNSPSSPVRSAVHNQQVFDDSELATADENEYVSLLNEDEIPVLELEATGEFGQNDFGAPTTAFEPPRQQVQAKPHSPPVAAAKPAPTTKRRRKRRGRSLLVPIFIVMVTTLIIIAGILYYGYQSIAITAVSVSFGPKISVVNQVYTISATAQATSINVASKVIPVKPAQVHEQGMMQGMTTGQINCILGFIDCQQAVSTTDVSKLETAIHSNLMPKLTQDLQNQIQAAGGIQVGAISFNDASSSANPNVGSEGKTVTVTLVEQATVGYIAKKDAQELARQLLSRQVNKGYHFIDSTIQIGEPVIEGIDNNGVVRIKIAAGGAELYALPQAEVHDIQRHLEGLTVSAAQAYIARQPGIDPNTIMIHFTQGYSTTLPADAQHISVKDTEPTTYPSFDLQTIPAPATPASTPTAGGG
ncbi:MAG TPA: serine/threonine-protein kinase [Ktedonobacteraceae bacterium]|nr:serine/threonine-protein kinase [Ktedonobacteraceae bacterium]